MMVLKSLDYERSARRDLTVWLMLLVGLGFLAAGLSVVPEENCNAAGECAPWLVPVAKWMGAGFALMAAGQLLANPTRGCRIDPESGDLIWWKNRNAAFPGQAGRIAPAQIARITLRRVSEGDDAISLFDQDGQRQFWFDAEVLPWPQDRWLKALVARHPHIKLEISG
ncbi:hypothetical protein [Gemmobacter serpentinus]|uniref:hypothetical protein n=1 Tax=Gemmobacter serpentinus TaxID=2652247 RepID=UPI00124F3FF3|nr:hypothetical protein [Gemmobacter serpentinus]